MWYYSKNGAQLGPIGPAEMESKLKAGEIASTDLIWKEGMADWLPVSKVPEIQALLSPPAHHFLKGLAAQLVGQLRPQQH